MLTKHLVSHLPAPPVPQLDLPHVYGLFTPASQYTEAVLRAMAFSGIRRVAVAMVSDNMLHRQLCGGALRELPGLAELRPSFEGAVSPGCLLDWGIVWAIHSQTGVAG